MRCAVCRAELAEGAEFCGNCGARARVSAQTPPSGPGAGAAVTKAPTPIPSSIGSGARGCPKCGVTNETTAQFCGACGAPMQQTSARASRRLNQAVAVVAVASVAVVVAVSALGLLSGKSETPAVASAPSPVSTGLARAQTSTPSPSSTPAPTRQPEPTFDTSARAFTRTSCAGNRDRGDGPRRAARAATSRSPCHGCADGSSATAGRRATTRPGTTVHPITTTCGRAGARSAGPSVPENLGLGLGLYNWRARQPAPHR